MKHEPVPGSSLPLLDGSCATLDAYGLPRVVRARRTMLEMLAFSVDLSETPDLQALMEQYGARPERFEGGERRRPAPIDDNPMYVRDYAKCVLCWRCVQVCAEDIQFTFALNVSGRGHETHIGTAFGRPMPETTCIFCGQCVDVCPSGALKPRREWLLEQGMSPEAMMQATLAENLRVLRETQQIDEALHGLTAAIHLLTARHQPAASRGQQKAA